jgi:predicted deacylase
MVAPARSPITAEIDFSADGKQTGFLRLPHSVHRSAYGWIPIPIAQIKNGDGPTLFLMSGNHGDEYEGQVTLTKLIQTLDPNDVRGRIILLPMANYPAAKAGMRTSPIDDGNLNRSFPGDPNGSVTQIIAHYIEHVLMEKAEVAIDLHSGGSSLHYLPTVLFGERKDPAENATLLELMRAFGAPYACKFGGSSANVSSSAARRQGTALITVEMGGSGTVSIDSLKLAEEGVRRVMSRFGFLADSNLAPAVSTRVLEISSADCYLYAGEEGLFEPRVELGDSVEAEQIAGVIHTPETPWKSSTEVRFKTSGLVICKRVPARVERGDCLFHLGTDLAI